MEIIMRDKLMDGTIQKDDDTDVFVHPLWYLLSTISHAGDDNIDKFFIKRKRPSDMMYEILNDVSFYFSRDGY